MTKMILLLAIVLPTQAFSVEGRVGSTSVSQLTEDSMFKADLRDRVLLDSKTKTWDQVLSSGTRLRCELALRSRFDRATVEASGPVDYRLDQIQFNSRLRSDRQVQEESLTLWLANGREEFPLLMLDCYAQSAAGQGGNLLTLGAIAALLGQPDFFWRPVLGNDLLSPLWFANVKRARLLQNLEFAGQPAGPGSSFLTEPRIFEGRLVSKDADRAACSVSYHGPETANAPWKLTLGAGREFGIWGVSASLGLIALEFRDIGGVSLRVSCSTSEDRPLRSAADVERHLRSVIDLIR